MTLRSDHWLDQMWDNIQLWAKLLLNEILT